MCDGLTGTHGKRNDARIVELDCVAGRIAFDRCMYLCHDWLLKDKVELHVVGIAGHGKLRGILEKQQRAEE